MIVNRIGKIFITIPHFSCKKCQKFASAPLKMTEKSISTLPVRDFAPRLLHWHRHQNKRQMPWKGEKDPYRIWLSEIILQQTRVEQGLAYYERFVAHFPSIKALAAAPDAQVMKLWEGLGYYSRCRNLLATARIVADKYNGHFPDSYETIKALKGIGPYTAAAIASFAYNLPHAVVDGNVYRVLARIWGNDQPIDSTTGKKTFATLADSLLDKKHAGLYNQAIMDFGATVCKPQLPLCEQCIFEKECVARRQNRIQELPVKEKKTKVRKRWFYYLVMEYRGKVAIRKRTEKDIWQDLYEFPVLEQSDETAIPDLLKLAREKKWLKANTFELTDTSGALRQLLSHQVITGRFIRLQLKQKTYEEKDTIWVPAAKLDNYAFPRFIRSYFQQYG